MIYIGFNNLSDRYEIVESDKNISKICSECNFSGELYRLIDDEFIEILNTNTFEFVEFRALFANTELFDICKEYLNQKLRCKYLYHHTTDISTVKNILKYGIKKNIGELYNSFLQDYLDEFEIENNIKLPIKYYNNINENNLISGIFLCSDIDYDLTDEDYIITIDRKYLQNIYRDFNETLMNCYFTTNNIPVEAIIKIDSCDGKTIYQK